MHVFSSLNPSGTKLIGVWWTNNSLTWFSTHFQPFFHFYTPWIHQETKSFFKGYRSGALTENGLGNIIETLFRDSAIYIIISNALGIETLTNRTFANFDPEMRKIW